jgi:hypothetical protein
MAGRKREEEIGTGQRGANNRENKALQRKRDIAGGRTRKVVHKGQETDGATDCFDDYQTREAIPADKAM